MTTAARPTWAPAKGGQEQGGTRIYGTSQKFSARDLPSHTLLKTRKEGQGTTEELQRKDLLSDLEGRERKHFDSKLDPDAPPREPGQLLLEGADRREGGDRRAAAAAKSLDADDSDEDGSGASDEEDEDEEDEDAALVAELERIRKEQAAEKLRKERERQMEDAKAKEVELAQGNPLLNGSGGGGGGSFAVKRRWDDDVVFKHQARGEPKQVKRFINDTIRSDFHRKFLNKYMK
ncbi:hypothetical protein SELMODRAFT_438896 [Selaginella moellendorffii]|uniref:Cwf15/Cwc15 cell cycle control protein n=1 Tax=Selaginella moellendorffii TaxID=88036 RepID=D8R091_SELML|nr:hypothetical protein SELMODRAFT_438896 [Selaginella moellendorffii]